MYTSGDLTNRKRVDMMGKKREKRERVRGKGRERERERELEREVGWSDEDNRW